MCYCIVGTSTMLFCKGFGLSTRYSTMSIKKQQFKIVELYSWIPLSFEIPIQQAWPAQSSFRSTHYP